MKMLPGRKDEDTSPTFNTGYCILYNIIVCDVPLQLRNRFFIAGSGGYAGRARH